MVKRMNESGYVLKDWLNDFLGIAIVLSIGFAIIWLAPL